MAIYWDRIDPEIFNAYVPYLENWAGLPYGTLRGIAMIESSYDPQTGRFRNGCNWLGACGMFQLRKNMLADIARIYKVNIDPTDPIQAMVGAALAFAINRRYLRYYTGMEPPIEALVAAYNGGWKVGYNYMAGARLPWETKNYLAKFEYARMA